MFVIVASDGFQDFYFSGWEGSDCAPDAPEMSFWKKTWNDIEVYDYDDADELAIELAMLRAHHIKDAIGLPDDFVHRNVKYSSMKIRQFNG